MRAAALLGLLPFATSLAFATQPDPTVIRDAARRVLGADQGVYVEAADGTILLAQSADRAVHPASVSKIPTTLALLRRLGDDHRFTTTFSTVGKVRNGILHGDLLVTPGGDPYLVDENALLIAARLRELGIVRIEGELRVAGPLVFNWSTDQSSLRLRQALSGMVPAPARTAISGLIGTATASPAPIGVTFLPAPRSTTSTESSAAPATLLIHRSQPLLRLVKQLNDYSNNVFAPLADAAGGAAAVQSMVRSLLPAPMQSELVLGDGAGADSRNRMSPRVAVRLLRLLETELAGRGRALTDALPVAGVDEGTLRQRLNGSGERGHVAGKTGTYGDYGASALTGAFNTREHGRIYFAILNRGVPVVRARRQQDAFVRLLLAQYGSVAWDYRRDASLAVTHAEVLSTAR